MSKLLKEEVLISISFLFPVICNQLFFYKIINLAYVTLTKIIYKYSIYLPSHFMTFYWPAY